jgi:gliding motility-associated-like protein
MQSNEARFSGIILCFVILFLCLSVTGQNESNYWYFGEHAGLDFNGGGTPTALTDGALLQHEGCASISNCDGELLFYTNGIAVWDKNHDTMPNGSGLAGDNSTTQSALIIRQPGSNIKYYVFTIDDMEGSRDLRYSIVDISLNGRLGDVTADKNIHIHTPVTEKLTAVGHSNGKDIWIIAHEWNSDAFLAYLLTDSHFEITPVVSNTGTTHAGGTWHNISNGLGYLKASPKGDKLALAIRDLYIEMFDFNHSTGIVSNPITFNPNPLNYGLEFSPDGKILYITDAQFDKGEIYQYDLTVPANSIISTKTFVGATGNQNGAMQLGPDGKIYVAQTDQNYLGVINNPNTLGLGCNFNSMGVSISPNDSRLGLPNCFVAYEKLLPIDLGSDTSLCIGETLSLDATALNATYLWSDNSSASVLEVTQQGTYWVKLTNSFCSRILDTIVVYYDSVPLVSLGIDTTLCEGDTLILDAAFPNVTYLWSDNSTSHSIKVNEAGTYWVEVSNRCGMGTSNITIETKVCKCDVYFPNAFTPNGDQINDVFLWISGCNFLTYDLMIFNRWGQLVFSSDSQNIGWDGTYAGKPAPAGVYVYSLHYRSPDTQLNDRKGTVTLIR